MKERLEAQIAQYGVSYTHVDDEHVFTFTVDTLMKLLKAAEGSGRAVIFVKTGAVN